MTDETKAGPQARPNGDKLNWRETNGVVTTDSQADGTDVSENQNGAGSNATEGGSMADGVAPDQRNANDVERSHEIRPDTGTPTGA